MSPNASTTSSAVEQAIRAAMETTWAEAESLDRIALALKAGDIELARQELAGAMRATVARYLRLEDELRALAQPGGSMH